MTMSAESIQTLPLEEKRALLAQLLQQKTNGRTVPKNGRPPANTLPPTIIPAPDDRNLPFPLTDIQQAYWVGRSATYEFGDVSIHVYSEIEGNTIDLDRLTLAWQRLVARHDMLRAVVLPDGSQQILEDVPPYEFDVQDLRDHTPEAEEDALAATRDELAHQVLPAEQWPGFDIRASLLANGRIRLHISIDLLHLDGGSLMILNDEWVQLYQNPDVILPPLSLSYRDYALAVTDLKASTQYQQSLDYWRERVPVLTRAPELPMVQNPSALSETEFVHYSTRLEAEAWQRLKTKAAKSGLTPSSILLTAYAEILAAWSKEPDFTINVTLFNRLPLHEQVNQILGDFTSMILLAVSNPVHSPFTDRTRQVQRQLWTDLEHRYVSGIEVLREFARVHGSTGEALMPVVFTSLLDLTAQGFQPPLASMQKLGSIVHSITQTPQVWLDHQVWEEDGELVLNWDAVAGIFPDGVIDEMFAAYCRLLNRLVSEPAAWEDVRHTHVSPAQLAQRTAVNDTTAPLPEGTLYTHFVAQAARQPDHPAVIANGRTLTYDDLFRLSNQIGRRLRKLGVQPNTLVAVVMEKGWEQVVAVLGIHASGAAYIPVDPSLPQERLWYLLENSQVQVALIQSRLDETLAWPDGIQRLCVDTDEFSTEDDSPVTPVQTPEYLSHVIYTSGSTGLPKGVMLEHRNVVNRLVDVNQRQQVSAADRVLALTALHHDLSVYDLFGMLMAGGTLVMPEADSVRDPAHWAELMVQHQVTTWNSVPAFLEMLVEYLEHAPNLELARPRFLRWAILAGDWIPVTLPDRLRALVPQIQIIASGGPTETTIWDVWYPVEQVDPAWKSIPYGKPMTNAQYDVFNEALEPCPVWVPGELYISGAGVARGYWQDEEKTQARFLTHPKTGERLYRSGDLGRFLPDGNIEFMGRADFQVKIGGCRIELGEIETALQQHPGVRTAVASAVGELRGHKRLVAYVVPTQPQPITVTPTAHTNGSNGNLLDDYKQFQVEGVELMDPLQRIEFKLGKANIRYVNGHPPVQLTPPTVDETLTKLYTDRRSHRQFAPTPILFEQFSELLNCLYHIELDGLPKYRYGSAGGLYPVQTYLHIKPNGVAGIAAGTYYYHPQQHQLQLLSSDAPLTRTLHAPNNRGIFDTAVFSIFLVAEMNAIKPMYGCLAPDFCLLEAGYMSQLLMMHAAEMGQIGLCPIGDMKFEPIRHLFALEDNHVLLHSLLGGAIMPDKGKNWSAEQKSFMQKATQKVPSCTHGDLATELRHFLTTKLPQQMIPSTIMMLDALPLTANGKVNRRALPVPDEQQETATVYEPPQSDVEQTLAAIVQEVLQVDGIGIHHNFFDLGGNSVHMVQILNWLRDTFKREIPITEIFRHPTISALAAYLSQAEDETNTFRRGDARAEARKERLARRQSRRRN